MNITAKIRRIIFSSKDTGFSILCLHGSGTASDITASGHVAFDGNPVGQTFNFTGEWGVHPKYGRQFNFTSCEPEGGDLFHFLAHVVKGLGPSLARLVLDTHGENTAWIIENEPQQLLQIKGIGQKKLEKVTESWGKYAGIRHLSTLLTPYGVTSNLIIKIFNAFEDRATALIKENPYCLSEIHGIGFKKADAIALAMGVAENSQTRIQECIKYVLNDVAETRGDTVLPEADVAERVLTETTGESGHALTADMVSESLAWMEAQGALRRMAGGYSLAKYFNQDKSILGMLRMRQRLPLIPLVPPGAIEELIAREEGTMGITLADEQRGAVRLALTGHRNIVIAGYAGTGKTTVSRIILRILGRVYGDDAIICMALSGIAADRVRKMSGFDGGTIHSTLGFGSDGAFKHGANDPLPFDVVLLDESSMVNSFLFSKILAALPPNTIFIMLGDPAQLPPIGAGDPFSDIINLDLCPVTRLTKIHRQDNGSVLVAFANEIRKGIAPDGYKRPGYADFHFQDKSIPNWFSLRNSLPKQEADKLKADNEEEIICFIQNECSRILPTINNPITDLQILAPMRKGALGTEALNIAVQEVMNPPDDSKRQVGRFNNVYREYDKVIHLQNKDMKVLKGVQDYLKDAPENASFDTTRRIYNGSVGMLWFVDTEMQEVHVIYPSLDLVVLYDFMFLGQVIDLAYCISVHKSQGSEYKHCIIPITTGAYIMLNNKWLYTAMTRAKSKCQLVGQAFMFERACKTLDESKRRTVLQELVAASVPDVPLDRRG